MRRIDSCITQLKAQGPGTCNESKEEMKHVGLVGLATTAKSTAVTSSSSLLLSSLELSDTKIYGP